MERNETLRPKYYYGRDIALSFQYPDMIYAVGFYAGQMEKVVTGACRYCMFRPDVGMRAELAQALERLTVAFGLELNQLDGEFWICKPNQNQEFLQLRRLEKNTPEYHILRAQMCGIHSDYIDPQYHTRKGHDEYKKPKYLTGECR